MSKRRTNAEQFFSFAPAMKELEDLNFAFSSIASLFSRGSYEGELAHNAWLGIRHRIDYLLDSFDVLEEQHKKKIDSMAPEAVAAKLNAS